MEACILPLCKIFIKIKNKKYNAVFIEHVTK